MAESFDSYLKRLNLAENTIASYAWTVNYFVSAYGDFTRENLLAYKGFLILPSSALKKVTSPFET